MAIQPPPELLTIRRHSPTTIHYSITDRPLPRTAPGYLALFLADLIRLVAAIWTLLIAFVVVRQHWHRWQNPGLDAGAQVTPIQQNSSLTTIPSRFSFQNQTRSAITLDSLADTLTLPLSLIPPLFNPSATQTSIQPPITPIALPMPFLLIFSTSSLLYLSLTTTETLLILHTLGLQISRSTTCFPLFAFIAQRLAQKLALDESLFSGLFRSLASLTVLTQSTRFIPTSRVQDVLIHEAFVGWQVRFYLGVVVAGEDGLVVVFERLLPRLDVVEVVWRGVREVLWEDDVKKMSEKTEMQGVVDEKESVLLNGTKRRGHNQKAVGH